MISPLTHLILMFCPQTALMSEKQAAHLPIQLWTAISSNSQILKMQTVECWIYYLQAMMMMTQTGTLTTTSTLVDTLGMNQMMMAQKIQVVMKMAVYHAVLRLLSDIEYSFQDLNLSNYHYQKWNYLCQ